MLEIARHEVPEAELIEADFTQIPLDDGSVDVLLAVHALLFASDRVAALTEWLRVTAPGGRISLSVPGPGSVVPSAVLGSVYDRYDIEWHANDYPDIVRAGRLGRGRRLDGRCDRRRPDDRHPARATRTRSGRGSASPASPPIGRRNGSTPSHAT